MAGLRIGLDPVWALDRIDAGIAAAVEAAADIMRDRGAEIVPLTLPAMETAIDGWPVLCSVEAAAAHAETYPSRADEYGPYFGHFLRMGADASGVDYARANQRRRTAPGHGRCRSADQPGRHAALPRHARVLHDAAQRRPRLAHALHGDFNGGSR